MVFPHFHYFFLYSSSLLYFPCGCLESFIFHLLKKETDLWCIRRNFQYYIQWRYVRYISNDIVLISIQISTNLLFWWFFHHHLKQYFKLLFYLFHFHFIVNLLKLILTMLLYYGFTLEIFHRLYFLFLINSDNDWRILYTFLLFSALLEMLAS